MVNNRLFDRRYGKGAFGRLRSMLADPTITYERVAKNLGLTKQRIGQLAKDFGVDGRQREYERIVRREPRVRIIKKFKEYPSDIRAVMNKLKRAGFPVTPYNSPQPSAPNSLRTSLRMVLVNGLPCMVQVRPSLKFRPNGREYARLDVGREIRRAKAALFAIRKGRSMKLYVIPTSHLRKVSAVYIPADGKYAVGSSKKPRKDWTRYEAAWDLLG